MNKPHPFAPGVIDAGEPDHNCNCWAYAIAMTLTTVALTIFVVGAYAGYMSEQAPSPAEQCAAQRFAAAALCREQYGESTYTWTQRGELVCTPRHGQSTTIYKGNK